MGITNKCLPHGITVFHKERERDGTTVYNKTYIIYTRIDERLAISQNNMGEKSLETFRATIDIEKSIAFGEVAVKKYISPYIFSKLSYYDKEYTWTITEGDYIFPCILIGGETQMSVTELRKKMRVFTVNSLSEQYNSRGLHHLEVSGRGKLLE